MKENVYWGLNFDKWIYVPHFLNQKNIFLYDELILSMLRPKEACWSSNKHLFLRIRQVKNNVRYILKDLTQVKNKVLIINFKVTVTIRTSMYLIIKTVSNPCQNNTRPKSHQAAHG